MKNTSKSPRLKARDVKYISWIAEQQAVHLDASRLPFNACPQRRLHKEFEYLGSPFV
jgi:hypothetical protein